MTMMDAEKMTRARIRQVMIGSDFFRGGLRITSWSTGSTPSDWLGGPEERRNHDKGENVVMKRDEGTHHP
jgi:hypothetical protein